MRLSELAALEAAYQALQPLSLASRRRALAWLADALAEDKPLVETGDSDSLNTQTNEVPKKVSRRAATKSVKVKKRRGPQKTAASKAAAKPGTRTYRRMPEATDIMGAYRQMGSINGLAEHFDVPVHTVYSWARRLRQQGYQIGR